MPSSDAGSHALPHSPSRELGGRLPGARRGSALAFAVAFVLTASLLVASAVHAGAAGRHATAVAAAAAAAVLGGAENGGARLQPCAAADAAAAALTPPQPASPHPPVACVACPEPTAAPLEPTRCPEVACDTSSNNRRSADATAVAADAAADAAALRGFRAGGGRIVALVFAGRRRYMRFLWPHLLLAGGVSDANTTTTTGGSDGRVARGADGAIDGVILAANTADVGDLKWLRDAAASAPPGFATVRRVKDGAIGTPFAQTGAYCRLYQGLAGGGGGGNGSVPTLVIKARQLRLSSLVADNRVGARRRWMTTLCGCRPARFDCSPPRSSAAPPRCSSPPTW